MRPKHRFLFLIIFLSRVFLCSGQNSASHRKPESIGEIPHATPRQLWMWPHRSFVLLCTRERNIDYDTAYIKSYYKRIVLTLPVSTRFLKFTLQDQKTGNKLTYVPNLQYNLGICVSSRWASFIVNSGVKILTGDSEQKGKTTYRDYQLHLYGRKINSDIFYQQYKSFFIRNSSSYSAYQRDKPYEVCPDVKALNIGASTVYVINNKRFSYGNAFAFVEQQKKSAGSLLAGVYYTYFAAEGKPSLVPEPFRSSFDSLSFMQKGHSHNFGVNIGYIYTLVFFKKIFATASVIQGIGAESSVYTREDKSSYKQFSVGAGKLNASFTLRYDNGRSFFGTMGMIDYFLFRGRVNSTLDYSFGKLTVYAGYRFSVLKTEKRILRKLKLIDYEM
jgi:hypothetical protein